VSAAGTACVVVNRVPSDERGVRSVTLAISKALHVPAAEVPPLLSQVPVTLPRRFDQASAEDLARTLATLGATSEIVRKAGPVTSCAAHDRLEASAHCSRCDAPQCALCCASEGSVCSKCRRTAQRRRAFFHLRVTFLLGVLVIVVLWAMRDATRRKARADWAKTLTVAIVVLRAGTVDPSLTEKLRDRMTALEQRLTDEYRRHGGAARVPFRLELYGPVDITSGPPRQPQEGIVDLMRYTFDLWRYVRSVNRRADLSASTVDSSIYVVTRPARAGRLSMVEGTSVEGGKIGIVEVDLDDDMADFALFVAAHELLHTLGATDKYDAHGRAAVPTGLAEPERVPLYPQRFAEVMARNVPLGPTTERAPSTLDELRVGEATAREIGWLK
jgi:hypothetical protein